MKKTISANTIIYKLKTAYESAESMEEFLRSKGNKERANYWKYKKHFIWDMLSELLDIDTEEAYKLLKGE